MNSTTTQAQAFAASYAANMATQMMKTIKRVRQAATAIMVIAMVVSYTHQAGYLSGIGTPALGAWLIPGALDALTFLCVKVLGTPGMAQPAKTMAIKVLVFPVLASGAINFMGPGELVTKLVFVLAVLMIPAAELVASRIKPDFQAMDTMERDMAPAVVEVEAKVAAPKLLQAEKDARKRAGYNKLDRASKAAWTKQYRERVARRSPVSPGRVPVDELNADMAMAE
jgi:hypothetical protein